MSARSKSDKAVEHRKLAEECFEIAERMSLAEDRQRMMSMAQRWLELAEKAEAEDAELGGVTEDGMPRLQSRDRDHPIDR